MADPAPPAQGPEPDQAALYRSLIDGSRDLAVAFDSSGTIVFANQACRELLGYEPGDLVGRTVVEFVHEDDLERALRALDLNVTFGSAPGTTVFRLRNAVGEWVHLEMTGGNATDGTDRVLYSSFSRRAYDRFAMSDTLVRLIGGAPVDETLRPVCDTFAWRVNGSEIGISWCDGEGRRGAVSTGIDLHLVGGDRPGGSGAPPGGTVGESPWDRVRRTGERVMDLELAGLDGATRQAATDAGMGAYWIEPVQAGSDEPALITVWTRAGGRPPLNHALAMEGARSFVEVILRWFEQQRRLDHAVYHDPLTDVANRARFFETLAETTPGGSVLYCDLDRFKAVNDTLGHAAGDELLCHVARRLQACVRNDDLVARLGGDEFAILCPGASLAVARQIATRVEAALSEPFALAAGVATIGASIGIGHDPERISEDTLEVADQQLYRAKGERARDRHAPST